MRVPLRARDANAMQLQMTPMIDVVFQLLIFFVCTTSFQTLEQILPTLLTQTGGSGEPTEVPPEIAELEDIIVKLVDRDGRTRWQINDQPLDTLVQVRERLGRLARIRRDLPVIVDAGSNVPLGDVIDIYDLCRVVGFEKIQFAARAEG
jgi:biopolymer transport protein ExbD